jgi:putative ATPase
MRTQGAGHTPQEGLFGPGDGEADAAQDAGSDAPLAARMRPRTLDEFAGQDSVVGPGTLLRRAIEQDRLTSAIFWGPPGSGKSTLAMVVARTTRAAFESYSAVTSGVADVRRVIERANERRRAGGRKTILFVDEIHRWNKAQQDALLPHVEDGTIVLIGATTENPYFEVNAPLLSRSRIFRFEPLSDDHIRGLLTRALADAERGLAAVHVQVDADALDHLVRVSGGDARNALNALEMAVQLAPIGEVEADGDGGAAGNQPVRTVTLDVAEQAAQQRVLAYDQQGDEHYDTISAFIKSVRGSDPDAALYWLAKMLTAGEDPRFIVRRLVILASEDVGNADPMGLVVANAAAQGVMFVGMPEAQLILAQATCYLATAAKSNACTVAIGRAMDDIRVHGPAPVPVHLRGSEYAGAKRLGHGRGYLYPHDYPGSYVVQEYAPDAARSGPYYEPTQNGHEARVRARMEARGQRAGGRADGGPDEAGDAPPPGSERPADA